MVRRVLGLFFLSGGDYSDYSIWVTKVEPVTGLARGWLKDRMH